MRNSLVDTIYLYINECVCVCVCVRVRVWTCLCVKVSEKSVKTQTFLHKPVEYFIRICEEVLYIFCGHYIYIYYRVVPPARISLTLSRHFSLSFIASGRSSGLHPVSSQSCCMYVRAGRPAFAWPYVGVHRSTSLMSSSLLLQQCPACLVRLTIYI